MTNNGNGAPPAGAENGTGDKWMDKVFLEAMEAAPKKKAEEFLTEFKEDATNSGAEEDVNWVNLMLADLDSFVKNNSNELDHMLRTAGEAPDAMDVDKASRKRSAAGDDDAGYDMEDL